MIYEFQSLRAAIDAWDEDPGLKGPSPGGAARELGITRQGIYSAVKRGSLDIIRVSESYRQRPYLFITSASIERYKQNQGKPGPRPGFRQRSMMEIDKHVHSAWPPDR